MDNLGSPEIVNGIIVDSFLISGWPEEFSGCWIAISKLDDGSTNANLIKNNKYPESEIVFTNDLDGTISSIKWNKFYRFISISTEEEYRNKGIAYLLARWARTWVAVNKGIQIQMPLKSERVEQTQRFIEDWKSRYNDPTTIV